MGVVAQRSTTPDPSLSKEENHADLFTSGGEPKEHDVFAQGKLGEASAFVLLNTNN